jgi:Arabinofuranosyltransferase N terminal/Arabinofuranosyltransferase A C terminal
VGYFVAVTWGSLTNAATANSADGSATGNEPAAPPGRPGEGARWLVLSAVAVVTWLILVATIAAVVHLADANPLTTRGALFPLAGGALGAMALAALAWWRSSDLIAAVGAGALASWVWFILLESLRGTPFPFDGLVGDAGRLTAMVTRYTVTWKPVDGIVPSVPTEYPPLFPYVVGHLAGLVNHPGWALLGKAEALTMSLAVLCGFLMWQRLVPGHVALVLAALPPYVFSEPRKSYEILTYAVGTPWALATFARFRERGGLHWLPAGIIAGLIVQTYQGFVLFGVLGLAALVMMGWRTSASRRAYLRHVALVTVVGFAVASWYLVPYIYGMIVGQAQRVNDLYIADEVSADQLGMGLFTRFPLGLICAIGLVGLVVLRRRRWWAAPILALVAGAFAYRYLYLALFALTGHTGLLKDTSWLLGSLLASAGVLTLAESAAAVARRVKLPDLRRAVVIVTAVAIVFIIAGDSRNWLPTPIGVMDVAGHPKIGAADTAAFAHAEIMPDGKRVHYPDTAVNAPTLLVAPITRAVYRLLGPNARPRTLSYTERLFAYLPWDGYAGAARSAANSLSDWDARRAALTRLAMVTDPAAFTQASRHTKYGAIDVFVLRQTPGPWVWNGVQFTPSAFAARYWEVLHLPHHTVVAVRKP